MPLDLTGKRVLLLGAETDLGRSIAAALAEAGARLALVGSSNDAETAFAVQRLARKLSTEVSQAIDATNEMAVRVMVRQVSKALAGLDGVVLCGEPGERFRFSMTLAVRFGRKELMKTGGIFIVLGDDPTYASAELRPGMHMAGGPLDSLPTELAVEYTLTSIAGGSPIGRQHAH